MEQEHFASPEGENGSGNVPSIFRRFTDAQEAVEWLQRNFEAATRSFTDAEIDAVVSYKLMTFSVLNECLRDPTAAIVEEEFISLRYTRSGIFEVFLSARDDFLAFHTSNLDSAMSKGFIPEPVLTYRAVEYPELFVTPEQLQGRILWDAAYQSTSLSEAFAVRWAERLQREKGQAAVLEIQLPAGTPAIAPHAALQETKNNIDARQQELLLPRRSQFRVLSVKDDSSRLRRIVVKWF